MNFLSQNYGCELFKSIGTGDKVELIPALTKAVCKCINVSDEYTWDNARDRQRLSMDQTCSDNNTCDEEAIFSYSNICF